MCAKGKELREQALKEDLELIEHVMQLSGLGEWYGMQITDKFRGIYRELEESIQAGKIMQDMLREYMTAAEIRAEFEKRLIHVDVTLEGVDDGRTETA